MNSYRANIGSFEGNRYFFFTAADLDDAFRIAVRECDEHEEIHIIDLRNSDGCTYSNVW